MPLKDDFEPAGKHKPEIMKALVHAADIGNPGRPYDLCKTVGFENFRRIFLIGDTERNMGLDITLLCDRKTTNIGKS